MVTMFMWMEGLNLGVLELHNENGLIMGQSLLQVAMEMLLLWYTCAKKNILGISICLGIYKWPNIVCLSNVIALFWNALCEIDCISLFVCIFGIFHPKYYLTHSCISHQGTEDSFLIHVLTVEEWILTSPPRLQRKKKGIFPTNHLFLLFANLYIVWVLVQAGDADVMSCA